MDPSYYEALNRINGIDPKTNTRTAVSPKDQMRIRNEEIERRLPIIDLNFAEYETALAQENVRVDFGIALAGVAVGGVGAFVTETASQVLSAVSAGLAGGQAAYQKAAWFDQAFPALLAQMRASRNQVRVKIYEGITRSYTEYPLSMAIVDLNDYIFAGSIPGAIAGTAKDAEAKDARATVQLREFTEASVTPEMFDKREQLASTIDGLGAAQAIAVVDKIEAEFPRTKPFIDAQYPDNMRDLDLTGDKAKKLLRRLVVLTVRDDADADKWQAAIDSL